MYFQICSQGTPSVTETFIDSKKEVDNQLKKTCEDFIALVTNMLIGPLKMFLDKVRYEGFLPTRFAFTYLCTIVSPHFVSQNLSEITEITRKERTQKHHYELNME